MTSYFCIPVPCNEKDIFFGVSVLKGLVGLHRTIQLQLLQRYWLGHRLGLLRYLKWLTRTYCIAHGTLLSVMSQAGWERSLGENG